MTPMTTSKGATPYQSSKWRSIFVHCEWNSAAVATIQSNHATDWAEGAKIGSRGVGNRNIHRVHYGRHGRACGECIPHVPRGGHPPLPMAQF